MRALVTGADGFVGRHLVPRLAAAGFEVRASDLELDVADAAAVSAVVRELEPGLIVHLAAISSVPDAARDPGLTYRVNFLGTRSVLEAAARHADGARVLLVSSADAYGSTTPGGAPFDEAAPLRPGSSYARTKAAADLLGGAYAARGLDVMRIRSFNHTGPGQTASFVLPSFAKQAVEIAAGRREPRLRVGNLDSARDFLDVQDVVEAYLRLADRQTPAGIYNVASGHSVRIGDALESILRIAGATAEIEVDPERFRPTDFAVGDAARLHEATGWEPRIAFEDTLRRLVEDWRLRVSES